MGLHVCLVPPPTSAEFLDRQQAEDVEVRSGADELPLGTLTVAAILEAQGATVEVVPANHLYYAYLGSHGDGLGFADHLAERLAGSAATVFGLSTVCSCYPLTLRLAGALRRLRPEARILLGGPQATATAARTLEAFPAVDLVALGEVDLALPALAAMLAGERDPAEVPGLAWRDGGRVRVNAPAPLPLDLDDLPLPAFHLVERTGPWSELPVEAGRGCPYACTFCSTNRFFARRFRLRSPERALAHMRALEARYGVRRFDLVHDMFTVDRRKVLAWCEVLEGRGYAWGCSARTDRVDEELLERMASAGCEAIFFGVETGSPRLQKVVRKRLDLRRAREVIDACERLGIHTEISLITAFPDEDREDLRATVAFLGDSLCNERATGNIGLLAPLAGTPLHREHAHELLLDGHHSDVSLQGWRQDPADRELIRAHPDIFPDFHGIPTRHLPRAAFARVREFVVAALDWFRRLAVGLHLDAGDLLAVHDAWLAWRGDEPPWRHPGGAPWFLHDAFASEFLAFVERAWIPESSRAPRAVAALASCERLLRSLSGPPPAAGGPGPRRSVPLARIDVDWRALRDAMRRRGDLAGLPHAPCWIAVRGRGARRADIIQLSDWAGRLLQACDGRPPEGVLAAVSEHLPPGVPGERLVREGLVRLADTGLLAQAGSP